jgi:hypothetical protein
MNYVMITISGNDEIRLKFLMRYGNIQYQLRTMGFIDQWVD